MNEAAPERPLWRWILLALSPSLAYVAFASLAFLFNPIAFLSVFAGLIVPIVGIIMLAKISDDFFTARGDPSVFRRMLFFVGFFVVNATIWFGGCGITAMNLDTIYDKPPPNQRPPARSGEPPSTDLSPPRPTIPDAQPTPPPPSPSPAP